MTDVRDITVGHSPDADDAFMFYALAHDKLDTGGLRFRHVIEDIESLNQRALKGEFEVTAISFHAYAYLADRYALLPHGASMGERYGPLVVAREKLGGDGLRGKRVAAPGRLTTATLVLRLYEPSVAIEIVPFDRIMDEVRQGGVEAGVLIHEGQLTYAQAGLTQVVDLGEWWDDRTGGLPLPLGGNAVRRDLGRETIARVSRLLRDSIAYGLAHREEALQYALQYGRGMPTAMADAFVGMYVNDLTLDGGPRGRAAVERLFDEAFERKLIPHMVRAEFVES